MLHAIDASGWDKNVSWCVPTCLSFLTGVSLFHSHSRAAFIRDIPVKAVGGLYGSEAAMLLREQGYRSLPIDLREMYGDAPKLDHFMANRTAFQKCMPMMIHLEDDKEFCHMAVAHYDYVADNWTMKPVATAEFPHTDKYVTAAWIVEKR